MNTGKLVFLAFMAILSYLAVTLATSYSIKEGKTEETAITEVVAEETENEIATTEAEEDNESNEYSYYSEYNADDEIAITGFEEDLYETEAMEVAAEDYEIEFSQGESMSYTTLPTYYEYNSMLNAQLSCAFWSGRLIEPMETIPFITTMSAEGGYEGMVDGMVISDVDMYGNSIYSYALGGGICSTAVALGNACDGVNIVAVGTEHTERSLYVRDEDIDYTVSEGEVELYITNNSPYTYRIDMWINEDTSVTARFTQVFHN